MNLYRMRLRNAGRGRTLADRTTSWSRFAERREQLSRSKGSQAVHRERREQQRRERAR